MINTTKPSKVPDKVEDGTIIHVYYIPDPSQTKELKYTVEYYKDGILVVDDTQHETESVQILQPDLITVHKEKINTSNKYENYVLDYTKPENIPDQVVTNSIINFSACIFQSVQLYNCCEYLLSIISRKIYLVAGYCSKAL